MKISLPFNFTLTNRLIFIPARIYREVEKKLKYTFEHAPQSGGLQRSGVFTFSRRCPPSSPEHQGCNLSLWPMPQVLTVSCCCKLKTALAVSRPTGTLWGGGYAEAPAGKPLPEYMCWTPHPEILILQVWGICWVSASEDSRACPGQESLLGFLPHVPDRFHWEGRNVHGVKAWCICYRALELDKIDKVFPKDSIFVYV